MNLCSYGHDEVCFDSRQCPVCEIIKEKDAKIKELEDEIASDQKTINDLSSQIPSQ